MSPKKLRAWSPDNIDGVLDHLCDELLATPDATILGEIAEDGATIGDLRGNFEEILGNASKAAALKETPSQRSPRRNLEVVRRKHPTFREP